MKERIQFLFIYFGFWTVYFLTARIVFLTYHIQNAKLLTLEELWGVFSNGIRMDMSVAAFLSVIPFLLVAAYPWIKKSIFERTIFSYTILMVGFTSLLIVIDLEVFNVWKYRLDATPLEYLKTPKEAFASARSSPLFRLFLSFLVLFVLASAVVYRIIAKNISTWKHTQRLPFVITTLLLTVLLIIPIKGGIGNERLEQGSVYFSNNNFANISALNAPWNFVHSLSKGTSNKINPFTYFPQEILSKSLDYLFTTTTGKTESIISSTPAKTNVLIIMWESFSTKVVDLAVDSIAVTPNFNQLRKEGVYFSNFFANGDRTNKALAATLSGFPSLPDHNIFTEEDKVKQLSFLSKDLENNGWQTEFYYGGETDFADMKTYLLNADFKNLYDINSFAEDSAQSQWGVHDHLVFNSFLDNHSSINSKPFFSTILTLSSHPPYEVPIDPVFNGNDETTSYFNALHYSDQALADFIEQAKQSWWWDNTMIVILGDHGSRLPVSQSRIDDFKVPLLFTGGAVKVKRENTLTFGQLDLPKTIKQQLGLDGNNYGWSKDIFNPSSPSWAYFNFNNGFGYIENKEGFVFDNVGKKVITVQKDPSDKVLEVGKALQQSTYDAYLDL